MASTPAKLLDALFSEQMPEGRAKGLDASPASRQR
jgi:hypothetical protein